METALQVHFETLFNQSLHRCTGCILYRYRQLKLKKEEKKLSAFFHLLYNYKETEQSKRGALIAAEERKKIN